MEIDGYYFGEHVIARSQPSGNRYGPAICYNGDEGRSIYPSAMIYSINYSISNGLTETQENGNNIHYCGSVKVITTADNRHIITVYDDPKQNK